jgi:hypothetical protein
MLHDVFTTLPVYQFTPLPPTIIPREAISCHAIALRDAACYLYFLSEFRELPGRSGVDRMMARREEFSGNQV